MMPLLKYLKRTTNDCEFRPHKSIKKNLNNHFRHDQSHACQQQAEGIGVEITKECKFDG